MDIRFTFNEETKNFEVDLKTYKYIHNVCFPDREITSNTDYSVIIKFLKIIEARIYQDNKNIKPGTPTLTSLQVQHERLKKELSGGENNEK